jgi:hypothetical protein
MRLPPRRGRVSAPESLLTGMSLCQSASVPSLAHSIAQRSGPGGTRPRQSREIATSRVWVVASEAPGVQDPLLLHA